MHYLRSWINSGTPYWGIARWSHVSEMSLVYTNKHLKITQPCCFTLNNEYFILNLPPSQVITECHFCPIHLSGKIICHGFFFFFFWQTLQTTKSVLLCFCIPRKCRTNISCQAAVATMCSERAVLSREIMLRSGASLCPLYSDTVIWGHIIRTLTTKAQCFWSDADLRRSMQI